MKDLITLVNQLRRYDSGYIHDIARQAEERKTEVTKEAFLWKLRFRLSALS